MFFRHAHFSSENVRFLVTSFLKVLAFGFRPIRVNLNIDDIHNTYGVVAHVWMDPNGKCQIKGHSNWRTLGFFHRLTRFLFDVSRDDTIRPQNNVDIVCSK